MSSIEGLKEQARRHEQKEEWGKALELYGKAIEKLAEEEQPDIGLYNRVGDLFTRTGQNDQAVESYESAVDLYLEADLPNNAIAVCKKILRNLPDRHRAFLRMGQIRASQGFLVDARQNFLTYAERMQGSGDLDEALRALVEFADLAPDDTEIRMAIATQFEQHERIDEAIEQLLAGHAILTTKGETEAAEAFAEKVRALDPEGGDARLMGGGADADDHAFAAFGEVEPDSSFGAYLSDDAGSPPAELAPAEDAVEVAADFAEISIGDAEEPAADDVAPETVPVAEVSDSDGEDALGGFGEIELGGFGLEAGEPTEDTDAPETAESGLDDFSLDFAVEADADVVSKPDSEPVDAERDAAEAELEAMASSLGAFGGGFRAEVEDDDVPEGGDLPLIGFDDDSEEDATPLPGFDGEEMAAEFEEPAPLPGFGEDEAATEIEDAAPLPGFGDDAAAEFEDSTPLPGFDEEVAAAEMEDAGPLANLGVGETPTESPIGDALAHAVEEAAFELAAAPEAPAAEEAMAADPRAEFESMEARAAEAPHDVELRQRMLEVAYRVDDERVLARAYLGLANALRAAGKEAKAQAMYQQVLSVDPDDVEARAAIEAAAPATRPVSEVTASEEYVDLGSLILGDEEEKTTRFTVAYEEPTGDEDADFQKMLSQFKAKVAENFDAGDVSGHHDLGTAYKEMGLLDEAIEEFQQALRASADHLPTYEMLGQTFLEKGEHAAAARVLSRALEAKWEVEDELLGIYYYLGRANEALGESEQAAEFYDRVFALDINFADVTERLRKLR